MSRSLVAMLVGGVVAAALVGLVLVKQSGARLVLEGGITGVRTLGMDEKSAVALVDFRFSNRSQYPFIVGATGMSLVDANGERQDGRIISAGHTRDLFEAFPALGAKAGETLVIKEKIQPGESRAGMLAARFEISKLELDQRKSIQVTVRELDGTVTEWTQ